MRPLIPLVVVLCSLRVPAESPQLVTSAITAVTLFADRAAVTREAALTLTAGVHHVEIPALPAWIDPASLRASLVGGEVLDVRTRKEFLADDGNAEAEAVEKALRSLRREAQGLEDAQQALDARRKHVQSLSTFMADRLPRDVVTRDIPVAYLKELVEFTHAEINQVDAEKRQLGERLQDLKPEMEKLQKELTEARRGQRLEHLHVTLLLKADRPLHQARFTLRYQLPGATWEPVHELRIQEGARVSLISLAQIRQTTGEDWENAVLSFSTRRPGQAARIPRLEAMLIGKGSPVNPVSFAEVDQQSWASVSQYYYGNGLTFNRANPMNKNTGGLDRNFKLQQATQRQSEQVFQRLEARGTTALFDAISRHTVRSDGEVVRVPYAVQNLEGTARVLAAPEISLNAARSVELTYAGDRPLLPGPAALFLDGAYIGNTALDYAGAGERIMVFAGTEDSIKLSRKLNLEESELRRGRRSNLMKISYLITVENSGKQPQQVSLADRIPVSNDRDIKVESVKIDPSATPGEDGLIRWDVEVPPGATRTFTLRYNVEYPSDLKRSVATSRAPATDPFGFDAQAEAPAAGAPLDESVGQILDLEKVF